MKLDPLNGEQPARGDGLIDCMAIVGWSYPPYPDPRELFYCPPHVPRTGRERYAAVTAFAAGHARCARCGERLVVPRAERS